MKNKFTLILEVMWLIIAIFSTVAGIYNLSHGNNDQATIFLVMAFISVVMYFMRRKLRESASKQK